MPLITVKAVEGRSLEQKRGLVKDITEAVVKNFGVPADTVTVDIVELKRENIAKGGQLFVDRQ
jgi:4-oxalocrotonate tautomerase